MPAAVFDQWIAPVIDGDKYKWPFRSVGESISGTKWDLFFSGRTLRHLSEIRWTLKAYPFSKQLFRRESWERINAIILNVAYSQQTVTANIQNTADRFRACAEFIKTNGQIPLAAIGIATPGGIDLMDGHHRLAALQHLRAPGDFVIPIWLGRL